jgi:hypothetical protein
MTPQELFAAFVKILKHRLEGRTDAAAEGLRKVVDALTPQELQKDPQRAQALVVLTASPASAASGQPTFCHYPIGGQDFCLPGLTETECTGLNGKLTDVSCAGSNPWPS